MKSTTTAIAALCSLLFVGCNALDRVGSQSVVFDSDPFTQIDNTQANNNQVNQAGYNQAANGHQQHQQYAQQPQGQPNHAAMLAQGQTPQAGRVSVGNLGGAIPPTYNKLPQTAPPQPPVPTAQTQYTYNPAAAPAVPAAPPVMNPLRLCSSSSDSSRAGHNRSSCQSRRRSGCDDGRSRTHATANPANVIRNRCTCSSQ